MPGSVCWTVTVSSGEAAASDGLLGEAEIEDLGAAFGRDDDVGGLQVAVGDAGGVGGGHAVGDLDGDVEEFLRTGNGPRSSKAARVSPGTSSLTSEEDAVLVADVVQADDVGMVEGGGGARLLFEAGAAGGVGGDRERAEL